MKSQDKPMRDFQQDIFNKVIQIRDECRNLESPKTIYGLLSILLHNLAGLIVNIDDEHKTIEDLYNILLTIAAEAQYGCEQLKLCNPQLQVKQEENIYKEKLLKNKELLKKIEGLQISYNPFEIQKGQKPKRLYEISDELFREIMEKINE